MRIHPLLAAAVLALAQSPPGLAQNDTGRDAQVLERSGETGGDNTAPREEREARSFALIGLSRLSTDLDNLGDAVNLDVSLGLRAIGWLSVEGMASITAVPGSNEGVRTVSSGGTPCTTAPSILDPDGTPDGCDPAATAGPDPRGTASSNRLQAANFGVFAVVRTPGRLYAVGKYGYRLVNSSISEIQQGDDRSGPAHAWGIGYRWGVGLSGVELGFTRWSSQLDAVGISLAHGFGASPGTGAH